jgi:hypothetical protein
MASHTLLTCDHCGNPFQRSARDMASQGRAKSKSTYCSKRCNDEGRSQRVTRPCGHCGTSVTRKKVCVRESKSGHLFCDNSCAALYNNAHKTVGTRRSKLEVWLEARLRELYPNLTLLPNDKTAINSELDFYFPDLNLAFELNGIFHYEPIYGPEKLTSIQNNDHRKFAACVEAGISLCIIDSSQFKHFKEAGARKYLSIICNIISSLAEGARFGSGTLPD